MTREEAIEILQALKFIVDFENYSDRVEIAIGMGIEALKREQKALELKPLVRNISGWNEMVNEISKLSKGDTLEEGEEE